MIIETLANSNPFSYGSGNAHKVLGPSLGEIITTSLPEFCICDYVPCVYIEKVFASQTSAGDFWKNDKSDFLFKRFVPVDTVEMELHKDGEKVDDLIDDTYGTYFDGFLTGSSEQQLYKGYLLDWNLIQAAFGNGSYTLVAFLDVIGSQTEYNSRTFNLFTFNDELAHDSVRIETVQNGNIIGSEFDFTDLDWYGSVRMPGKFGNPTPIYETDSYVTEQRVKRQIQDKMSREWELNTKLINYEVANVFLYNKLLANQILITDYNIFAESVWRRISVRPSEVDKPKIIGRPERYYTVKFVDERDKYIKRNF